MRPPKVFFDSGTANEMLHAQWRHNMVMVVTGTVLYVPLGAVVMTQGEFSVPILMSYLAVAMFTGSCFFLGRWLKDPGLRAYLPLELCFYVSPAHQFILLHYTSMEIQHVLASNMLFFAGMLVMGALSRRHAILYTSLIGVGMVSLLWVDTAFPVLPFVLGYIPLGVFSYISGIERIRIFEDLAESRIRLDQALGNASMSIWTWNASRDYIEFDRHANEVFRVDRHKLPRNRDEFSRFFAQGSQASAQELFFALQSGVGQTVTLQTAMKDRYLRAQVGVVETDHQRELVGLIWDVSEEIKAKKQVEEEQARSAANARLASVGEMAAGVAHEVNNPLTIVLGSIQSLERVLVPLGDQMDPTQREKVAASISRIKATTDRIGKIVRGLMRLSLDGETEAAAAVSLLQMIEETLELGRQRLALKGIRLDVELPDASMLTQCRSTQVSQVILNLTNNAFDAVVDQPDPWIKVSATSEGKWGVIRVIDSGKGIPAEVRDRIFEPFFTTKPVGSGTGLGLSISKTLITNQGGTIEVDSSYPNTCFVVRLPLADG